jgi:flagellar hook assembly protein FlgD
MRRFFVILTQRYSCLPTALAAFLLIGVSPRAHAAVIQTATLSNFSIPFENGGTPTGSTITYTLTGTGTANVEIDIFRLKNVSDTPSAENQVAAIQQANVSTGTFSVFWSGLWLLGDDNGRQNGNFQVIVNADAGGSSKTNFVISPLLQITSVDIHSVTVLPSTDAGGNPVLPYVITYSLAKNSQVTMVVKDTLGTIVRTLIANKAQFGEDVRANKQTWDGLDNNGLPVPLGVYIVQIDAHDSLSADVATTRTRTASIQSLASLNTDPKQRFETNAFVFPNPVRGGTATFQALAVRNNATISIKVYTIAGDLVREESRDGLVTAALVSIPWNADNQAGRKVGRGLYYVVFREVDEEGTLQTVKKIAVIP